MLKNVYSLWTTLSANLNATRRNKCDNNIFPNLQAFLLAQCSKKDSTLPFWLEPRGPGRCRLRFVDQRTCSSACWTWSCCPSVRPSGSRSSSGTWCGIATKIQLRHHAVIQRDSVSNRQRMSGALLVGSSRQKSGSHKTCQNYAELTNIIVIWRTRNFWEELNSS